MRTVRRGARREPPVARALARGFARDLRAARRILRPDPAVGQWRRRKQAGGVKTSPTMADVGAVAGVGMVQELAAISRARVACCRASTTYKASSRTCWCGPTKRLAAEPGEFDEVEATGGRGPEDRKEEALIAQKRTRSARCSPPAPRRFRGDQLRRPQGHGLLPKASGFVPLLGNEPRVIEKAFTQSPPRSATRCAWRGRGVDPTRGENAHSPAALRKGPRRDRERTAGEEDRRMARAPQEGRLRVEGAARRSARATAPKTRTVTTTITAGR